MKGSRLSQFKVGDRVAFHTNIGIDVFAEIKVDKQRKPVKVFSHKNNLDVVDFGRVIKLHKSGRQGSAEIRPEDGRKRITRRLQHVEAVS